jgi:hypothetical protein
MGKARLVVLIGAVLTLAFGLVLGATRFFRAKDEVEIAAARPADAAGKGPLARASQRVLTDLPGVYLTMLQTDLVRVRPAARRNSEGDEPTRLLLQEELPNGRMALYFTDKNDLRLQRVQLATRLRGVEEIQDRVDAEGARFGVPTGIWDCPLLQGSLPTRRFTWLQDGVAVMDNYLIVGESVSATLVVAAAAVIKDSLMQANCRPVPPDRMSKFPIVPPGLSSGSAIPPSP